MTDFDFDELDKAVSGALNGPQPAPADTTQPQVAPQVVNNEVTAAPEANTVAPAARRSTGRFMDMVHPSSNMRNPGSLTSPVPPRPVQPATQPAQESLPSSPTETTSGVTTDAQAAPESPFLPDAKVEKRPLGGAAFPDELTFEDFSSNNDGVAVGQDLIEAPEAEPKLSVPEENPMLESPEPEERIEAPEPQDRIDAPEPNPLLETEEGRQSVELDTEPQQVQSEEESVQMQISAVESAEFNVENEAAAPTESVSTDMPAPLESVPEHIPAAAASIPQQYTEKPSTAAENGAIFDTESYHSPIPANTKKKSAIWVVMWIILLIVAGAGAGAAFYVYVLPML